MNVTTTKTSNPDFSGFLFYVKAGREFDNQVFEDAYKISLNDKQIESINAEAKNLNEGEWLQVEAETTIAEQFSAKLNDDGQNWETDEGTSFEDLAEQMGATVTYSSREYDDNGEMRRADGYQGGHISGDPIRYEFSDGSAVVVAGDGWDLEGAERYSWAGA